MLSVPETMLAQETLDFRLHLILYFPFDPLQRLLSLLYTHILLSIQNVRPEFMNTLASSQGHILVHLVEVQPFLACTQRYVI